MNRILLIAMLLVQGFIAWQLWEINKYDRISLVSFGPGRVAKIQKDIDKSFASKGWNLYSVPTVATNA